MMFTRLAIASLVTLSLAGAAAADDSGYFVVRLGRDTTSLEHYTRTASRLEVDQVGRAPRVLQRHFVYDYANGSISHFTMVVTPPADTTPTQTIDAGVDADSLRIQVHSGSAPATKLSVAMVPGMQIVPLSSPWTVYEGQIMKLGQGKNDSLRTAVYFLGSSNTDWLSLQRLGRDSVVIFNTHGDLFHARVDKAGRILGVLPISGTGKFSVDRIETLDLSAMTASYAAREKAGAGLGTLSPRDTVNVANAGGARLWVDYGRPSKRGRVIFGNVVPFGAVWRTGANAATQFKTDKPLDFLGTVVPAGFYTLWTIPSEKGWKLIFNSETGQWGTEHKPAKDLYTIDLRVSTLEQPVERFTIGVDPKSQGGVLRFEWDTTRASTAFLVKP